MIEGRRTRTADGVVFRKTGGPADVPALVAEAVGLQTLAAADTSLRVPVVLRSPETGAAASGGPVELVIEWLEPVSTPIERAASFEALGRGLAELHGNTGKAYGFHADNFIGRAEQKNPWHHRWDEFFTDARILPMVDVARKSGRWQADWNRYLDRLIMRIPDLLPADPPRSLVHGDLWSGNMIALADGVAAVIDPAVYYGHREVDIAMTELFGGFESGFNQQYSERFPLEAGYTERRDIYNLYHLLNHLNIFGSSYAASVDRVLRRVGS